MRVHHIMEQDPSEIIVGKQVVKRGEFADFEFETRKDGSIKITAPDGTVEIAKDQKAAEKVAKKMKKKIDAHEKGLVKQGNKSVQARKDAETDTAKTQTKIAKQDTKIVKNENTQKKLENAAEVRNADFNKIKKYLRIGGGAAVILNVTQSWGYYAEWAYLDAELAKDPSNQALKRARNVARLECVEAAATAIVSGTIAVTRLTKVLSLLLVRVPGAGWLGAGLGFIGAFAVAYAVDYFFRETDIGNGIIDEMIFMIERPGDAAMQALKLGYDLAGDAIDAGMDIIDSVQYEDATPKTNLTKKDGLAFVNAMYAAAPEEEKAKILQLAKKAKRS